MALALVLSLGPLGAWWTPVAAAEVLEWGAQSASAHAVVALVRVQDTGTATATVTPSGVISSAASMLSQSTGLPQDSEVMPVEQYDRQQEILILAQGVAAAGDTAEARRILTEAFGADTLALPFARPALVTQCLLRVDSTANRRTFAMRLVDGGAGASASEVISETAAALSHIAPIAASSNALTVTITFSDPEDLVETQDRLRAALPDLPELALLASALDSRGLDWRQNTNPLSLANGYEERVDLRPSMAAWDAEAEKLLAAAAEAEKTGDPVDAIRAMIWRTDARVWRDLSALSRATYTVELEEESAGPEWLLQRVRQVYEEGTLRREWAVRPGETRQLEAEILGWRYDRLAMLAAAALVAVAVIFGVQFALTR